MDRQIQNQMSLELNFLKMKTKKPDSESFLYNWEYERAFVSKEQ